MNSNICLAPTKEGQEVNRPAEGQYSHVKLHSDSAAVLPRIKSSSVYYQIKSQILLSLLPVCNFLKSLP